MVQELLAAVQNSGIWMRQFNRRDYPAAFEAYCGQYGAAYAEAARQAEDAGRLVALAEQLLDAVEADWMNVPAWRRNGVRFNTKNMFLVYVTPMLLSMEDAACVQFAEMLRRQWTIRQSKEAYELVTYQTLRDGFKVVLPVFGNQKRTKEKNGVSSRHK